MYAYLRKTSRPIKYNVVLNILTKHQTSKDDKFSMRTHFIEHP